MLGGQWRAASLRFVVVGFCFFFVSRYARFQFACSEINVRVRQCNKLAYNLHLRKKKISNSVPTLILNTKYKQIITWCLSFLFFLHFRYRYKQCDIQNIQVHSNEYQFHWFHFSFFFSVEALFPPRSRWVSPISLNSAGFKWSSTSTTRPSHPSAPHSRFGNRLLKKKKICSTYWRWLRKK